MWKLFFEICDILCWLIPNRRIRNKLRHEQLFDWRRKYNALRKKYPELNFKHTVMIKGGWNIGFIIDNRYVFKIRKHIDRSVPTSKITREQRITNALADVSPLRIPRIEIVRTGGYTFYKYDFIPGKNLNKLRMGTIIRHREKWGRQIAEFIYAVHNARPDGLDDLRGNAPGDGWNHNDMCNNMIVDTRSMTIVGLIDWEYAGWGTLKSEFDNTVVFSSKMRRSGIQRVIISHYQYLANKRIDKE